MALVQADKALDAFHVSSRVLRAITGPARLVSLARREAQHRQKMPEPDAPPDRPIGLWTGTLLVIANMVGVGVFITTGDLLSMIGSGPGVLAAWFVGGIAALCGALCYAELGAALPRNGGEYFFLTRTFHPLLGFLSGWVSALAGFCAPLALVAWAFGSHLHEVVPDVPAKPAGMALIAICATMHTLDVRGGHVFQNIFTGLKMALILGFVGCGLAFCSPEVIVAGKQAEFVASVVSPGFAVGLVLVCFAYSGWNAAGYVAGEYRNPQRELPLSLVIGTLSVTAVYLLLNFVFLASAPAEVLMNARSAGMSTLGHAAAVSLFGERGGRAMSLLIVLGLIASAGAFLVAGSRMIEAMGQRHRGLGWLAVRRSGGGPVVAIVFQSLGAMLMMQTEQAEPLLIWVGLTLSLFTFLTVTAVIVLRLREPDLPRPYRTWGYPLTPILFLAIQTWVMLQTIRWNPWTALASGGLLAAGAVLYLVVGRSAEPEITATESDSEAVPTERPFAD